MVVAAEGVVALSRDRDGVADGVDDVEIDDCCEKNIATEYGDSGCSDAKTANQRRVSTITKRHKIGTTWADWWTHMRIDVEHGATQPRHEKRMTVTSHGYQVFLAINCIGDQGFGSFRPLSRRMENVDGSADGVSRRAEKPPWERYFQFFRTKLD